VSAPALASGLTREEAVAVTGQIREAAVVFSEAWAGAEEAVRRAYEGRAWQALGYGTWEAYCQGEFSQTRLFRTVEERRDRSARLAKAGLSSRAIGALLGIGSATARRDRQLGAPDGAPDGTGGSVQGRDGKTYKTHALAKPEMLARNLEILDALAGGRSQSEVAAKVGVTQGRVSQVKAQMREFVAPLAPETRRAAERVLERTELPAGQRAAEFARLAGIALASPGADLSRAKIKRGIEDALAALKVVGEVLDQRRPGAPDRAAWLDGLQRQAFELYARATELWAVAGPADQPLSGTDLARYRSAIRRAHAASMAGRR
jgi:predicted XRE-type DNA-binding protein